MANAMGVKHQRVEPAQECKTTSDPENIAEILRLTKAMRKLEVENAQKMAA